MQDTCELREISDFDLKFPYLNFCKGNAEIFIKNLHNSKQQIVMPLAQDETFFSFLNIDGALIDEDTQIKDKVEPSAALEVEDIHLQDKDQEMEATIANLDNFNHLRIGYITLTHEGFKLNYLKARPYQTKENMLFEHFIGKEVLKRELVPQKEIIQAAVFDFDYTQGQKKVNSSTLIIQYRDSILVKSINLEYRFLFEKNLAPIRMVRSKTGGSSEFFYVTKEKVGSEVKIISFKEDSTEPEHTVRVEQT